MIFQRLKEGLRKTREKLSSGLQRLFGGRRELDEEFLAEAEEEGEDLDRILDRVDRKAKPGKKGKAAWSKLEDVLAERRLARELKDIYGDEGT